MKQSGFGVSRVDWTTIFDYVVRSKICGSWKGRYKAAWERKFDLPWCEAGPPNHLDDEVDPDQQVSNKELSLSRSGSGAA